MDLRKGLLAIADRLEGLAGRLPEPLKRPILNEFRPLKELFLVRRVPRLLLVGGSGEETGRLVAFLFEGGGEGVEAWVERPGWLIWRPVRGSGVVGGAAGDGGVSNGGAGVEGVGFLVSGPDSSDLVHDSISAGGRPDTVIIMSTKDQLGKVADMTARLLAHPDPESARMQVCHVIVTSHRLSALASDVIVTTQAVLRQSVEKVVLWGSEALEGRSGEFMNRLVEGLPSEARLAFVRSVNVPVARRQLARSVVRSISAVSAAVGAQPIPLADFPVLTSLQGLMVAAIMDISGRRADFRAGSEFLASIGVNVGAGLALREGARAVVKLVPGFGNAISGAVAAAGTYAIGRAAIAYFIDGVDLGGARALFRRRASKPRLKSRGLLPPPLPDDRSDPPQGL